MNHIIRMISLLLLVASMTQTYAQTAPNSQPVPAASAIPIANNQAATALTPVASKPTAGVANHESNPYGIEAMWKQGDIVARGTLFLLFLMSAASWYVGAVKFLEQRNYFKDAKTLSGKKGELNSISQRFEMLPKDSPFLDLTMTGREAAEQIRDHPEIDANTWVLEGIGEAVERVASSLQSGLSMLATVASTAPFVGLFGTVWGIYHALTAIGIAGQASIDKVAGPVGEALIMTAIGLAVAVPAVFGYNFLIRRNKSVMDKLKFFGTRLHSEIVLKKAA